jgi:hypothetical protein
MAECTCWGLGAWASLALAAVSTSLFLLSFFRLATARRLLLRVARERDASREALLDATVRREVAEAEQSDVPEALTDGPLDLRLLAESEVRRAARYGRDLSMVLVRLPSPCLPGDPCWTHLARHLRAHLRDSDHAGRIDATSTLIVLTETEPAVAEEVAGRLVEGLSRQPEVPSDGIRFAVDALTPADASAEAVLTRLARAVDDVAAAPEPPSPA